jgi:hypothetical protein
MPTRCDDRALSPGPQGLPRFALILGGLLLLMVP